MRFIRRVVVGVSGGVDSAVAALLLKGKGYEVHGAFMKNWDETDETGFCSATKDAKDAEWLCSKLNIPFHYVDFVKEYWHDVFSNLLSDYQSGYTPNPDILCNQQIKFNSFYKYAREVLGADAIATGHYALTTFGDYLQHYNPSHGCHLLQAKDSFKDQTFFLSQVSQSALQCTMFPLGNMLKSQVRSVAKHSGMEQILKRKESMGICFIGLRNFQEFISQYIATRPGKFVDIDSGKVVGEHEGIHHWTLGQRCRISGQLKPYFVARKEPSSSIIYVAAGTHHPSLFTQHLMTLSAHWIHSAPQALVQEGVLTCGFRFQHTKPLVDCQLVNISEGRLIVHLLKPVRAITPGQYAVFYKDERCLGSARIQEVGPSLNTLFPGVEVQHAEAN